MTQIGSRIGAILGSDDKQVQFLGYGTYEGEEIPPPEVGGFNIGAPNPKLKLDNGSTVWGCECWWGSEAKIKAKLERWEKTGLRIVTVDINEWR